jgi:Flp pilus assembly protein TadD
MTRSTASQKGAGAALPGRTPPASPSRERARRTIGPAVVVLVGLLAYSNAFRAGFVFDDPPHVVDAPWVGDPASYLPGGAAYRLQPNRAVGGLTFALNRRLLGPGPAGFHAVNVLVHLLNALLVHALILLSFRTPRLQASALAPWSRSVAFVAALLFVAHPIQTQAVTYVVQRLASLATTFYLLAVVLYARWRLRGLSGRAGDLREAAGLGGAVLAAVLAVKTKEIAFTLPVAVALFEALFFEGRWGRRVLALAPFALTTAIIPLGLLGLDRPLGEMLSDVAEVTRVQTAQSRWDYLVTEVPVVATYLRLLALPVGQNVDHDFPSYRSLLEPPVALSLGVLLALAAVAVWPWVASRRPWVRREPDPAARLVSFGVAWFFLGLLVESSVIPIADVMFEHRVYLPSAGLLVAVATGLGLLARRHAPSRPAAATAAVGAALALPLAAATWMRNQVWADEVALWTDAVEKSPRKARPRNNLGVALGAAHRDREALLRLQEAVRLDPGYARAHDNLGVVLSALGRDREAEAAHLRAMGLAPRDPEPHYNLGCTRLEQGRYGEAAVLFEQALALQPDHARATVNLAAAWNGLGRFQDVVRLLSRAGPAVLGRPEARLHLALARFELGDRAAAEREALALEPVAPAMAAQLRAYFAGRATPAHEAPSSRPEEP